MPRQISEELTRKEMIDPQLEKAGWYLRDHAQEHAKVKIEIPVDGYDAEPWNGVSDYCHLRPRKWESVGGDIIVLQFCFDKGEVKMQALTIISSKYQIVIPREVRKKFNLKPGQKLMFIPYQKSIRLVIMPSVKDALGMFKGMKIDNIREGEDEER